MMRKVLLLVAACAVAASAELHVLDDKTFESRCVPPPPPPPALRTELLVMY